ncbi:hypothetical protein LTS18_009376 [Coniosporium uncinatum]|uniref:Uncharacterized protein n=1 Tax=Coniosporium uncinatum TaxID=93489 RepID=A0ACC3DMD9_9PEZI|nr:hypothetical protein LTS18_009376 [Coniosporium uncinatum]
MFTNAYGTQQNLSKSYSRPLLNYHSNLAKRQIGVNSTTHKPRELTVNLDGGRVARPAIMALLDRLQRIDTLPKKIFDKATPDLAYLIQPLGCPSGMSEAAPHLTLNEAAA